MESRTLFKPNAVLVKICGVTDVSTALAVEDAGADAVGLVFYRHSRRAINPEVARSICSSLTRTIPVGVFVNDPLDKVQHLAQYCGIRVLQFHGEEPPSYCSYFKQLGYQVWKTFRICQISSPEAKPLGLTAATSHVLTTVPEIQTLQEYDLDAVLFDTYSSSTPGGSGKPFPWGLIQYVNTNFPIIVAGGLTPENVAQAISIARPQGLDVSSGVESSGKKDVNKIKLLVSTVRKLTNR